MADRELRLNNTGIVEEACDCDPTRADSLNVLLKFSHTIPYAVDMFGSTFVLF